MRSLLGLQDGDAKDENRTNNAINGEPLNTTTARRAGSNVTDNTNAGQANRGGRGLATTLAEEMLMDSEAAVMANFEFLSQEVGIIDGWEGRI